MPDTDPPSVSLGRQVRNALAHLYDHAYLQNHPLAALVDRTGALDQVTRAQRLRRLLLDCIEALRPQEQKDAPSDAARAHAILTYRYVDGIPIEEIAEKRGLSERQTYRELEKGVEAVASLLQDRMRKLDADSHPVLSASQEPDSDPLRTVQAEVARLRQAVNAESLDLRDILQGVLALLAPICQRTGVRILTSSISPWPPVIADRVMLRQALLNLLTHALDTAARADLAIDVSSNPGNLTVDIEEAPTAARTHPLSPSSAEPPSVGLSAAQALIEAQGGELAIRWTAGSWQARVLLPTARGTTILVVDDNEDLVALLRRYLAGHEVTVVGATGGAQALHLAEEIQPQLITLDVLMPGQDGWEILQSLRGSPTTAHIPVVVCSVLRATELAQTMGAADYITKPVVQADLLEVLRRWLGPLHPVG